MRKFRKWAAVFCAGVIAITSLAGCGGQFGGGKRHTEGQRKQQFGDGGSGTGHGTLSGMGNHSAGDK